MVRPIMKDEVFLKKPSQPATRADLQLAEDLLDTLKANREHCVGMAANMIGVLKNVIAVEDNGSYLVLFNPVISKKMEGYETEEGCLSLSGTRKTLRYKMIMVQYQNQEFEECATVFTGWTAQIIQHEIDHCNGILI